MANKIFRQVLCSERLPKESGAYIVDVTSSSLNSLIWAMTYWYDRFGNSYRPTEIEYWLEEVELPSDEEIEVMATNYATDTSDNVINSVRFEQFTRIFNKAIKLIKGEGLKNPTTN